MKQERLTINFLGVYTWQAPHREKRKRKKLSNEYNMIGLKLKSLNF